MISKSKQFEYLLFLDLENPYELQELYSINQAECLIEHSSGSSRDAFDGFWTYSYQYRILGPGSVESRLREAKYNPNVGDEVRWHVKNGEVCEDKIKAGGKSFALERLKSMHEAVQWHLETNPVLLLCIFHGDDAGTKKVKENLLEKLSSIERGVAEVTSLLRERFGAELGVGGEGSSSWITITKKREEELSDWFSQHDCKAFGLEDWWTDLMEFRERKKFFKDLIENRSLMLVSTDVWDDESLKTEVKKGVESVFATGEVNHGLIFLDGAYLKAQFMNWSSDALRKVKIEDASEYFEKYERFLREVDWGMGHEHELNPDPRFSFPYFARAAELEDPVGEYLQNKDWQNDYLDWVLIGSFLRMEAVSSKRELGPALQRVGLIGRLIHGKKIELINEALSSLGVLAQLVESRTYSIKDILDKCRETRSKNGFVHPIAIALLENRLEQGKNILTFPEGARTPERMEQLFFARQRQQAKAG